MKAIIKTIVLAIILTSSSAFATISGPSTCVNGELAILESSKWATWAVYPTEFNTAFTVADDGKTCIFASPKKGCVTFIAACVKEDQTVELCQHILYNGVEPTQDDVNQEEKEGEKDDSLEGIIKTESSKVQSDTKKEEMEALSEAFSETVSGINRGTVRTPEGARATFRALWVSKGSTVSTEAIKRWQEAITAISSKIDNTSLEAIKNDYERACNAIKNCTPAKAVQGSSESTTGSPSTTNPSCPTGNCPTGNCPNQQQYQGRRFITW